MSEHKYVTVAYDLSIVNEEGKREIIETAPIEHPFQFISNMGVALESFENKVVDLSECEPFEFDLSIEEAYGPYDESHVIDLDKEVFKINGRFDSNNIYPGCYIPLVNEDGNRFEGLVLKITDDKVQVDLNHPLAGKALHFKGQVVTNRPATEEEVQGMINMMTGEGCGCGCGEECGCEHEEGHNCGCHHEEGHCHCH